MYYHSIKSENSMEPSTVQSCVTIANGAPKTSVLGISIIVIVNNTNKSTYWMEKKLGSSALIIYFSDWLPLLC